MKGLSKHVIFLVLSVIFAILILIALFPAFKRVYAFIQEQFGLTKPLSQVDKAILCSYYRCKYGIIDDRTDSACEDFQEYNKPSLDCDQGGLLCMKDLFLPEWKVCDEVSAAYPIVVEVEEGKELEINKNNKFGDDGNADYLCVNYPGRETGWGACPQKEQSPGYGDYDKCRTTHNCRLSAQFGYNIGHYGSEISKSIFLDSALTKLGEDCADSVKIKSGNKLYVTTDYYTRIFSEENRDKITNVVPTLLQLKVGETSHKIYYCGDGRKGISGLFVIEDLDDDGNKENVTGVKVVANADPLSIKATVNVNASCKPDEEKSVTGLRGIDRSHPVISTEFCDGKYNLTANVMYDGEGIDLTIWVKRIGGAGALPGGGLPPE